MHQVGGDNKLMTTFKPILRHQFNNSLALTEEKTRELRDNYSEEKILQVHKMTMEESRQTDVEHVEIALLCFVT